MKKNQPMFILTFISLTFLMSATSYAKTIRFSELTERAFQSFLAGSQEQEESEDILEFRVGDSIQVSLKVDGDILETPSLDPNPSTHLIVKKNFFLKKQDENLLVSWDGEEFRSIGDSITGTFSASASGNPTATEVRFLLSAYMRQ